LQENVIQLTIRLAKDTPWAKANHVVAWEQAVLVPPEMQSILLRPPSPPPTNRTQNHPDVLKVEEHRGSGNVVVSAPDFEAVFSRSKGGLVSFRYQGCDLFLPIPGGRGEALQQNFWRVPTDNDNGSPGANLNFLERFPPHRRLLIASAKSLGILDTAEADGWRKCGLDSLVASPGTLSVERTTEMNESGSSRRPSVVITCAYSLTSSPKRKSIQCELRYHLFESGEMIVDVQVCWGSWRGLLLNFALCCRHRQKTSVFVLTNKRAIFGLFLVFLMTIQYIYIYIYKTTT
jgi:hypothetical protein